jgi:hypothetical protein
MQTGLLMIYDSYPLFFVLQMDPSTEMQQTGQPLKPSKWARKSDSTIKSMFHKEKRAGRTTCLTYHDFKASLPNEAGWYAVNIPHGYCTCSDHVMNQIVCKHMFAVMLNMLRPDDKPVWSFNDLPLTLTKMPHLILDSLYTGKGYVPSVALEEVRTSILLLILYSRLHVPLKRWYIAMSILNLHVIRPLRSILK